MPRTVQRRQALRELNDGVAHFAEEWPPTEGETWLFVCECGDEECSDWIEIDLIAFHELRVNGMPILAEGHPEETQAAGARRLAARLREEAQALRAQARHQVKRSRGTLGGD